MQQIFRPVFDQSIVAMFLVGALIVGGVLFTFFFTSEYEATAVISIKFQENEFSQYDPFNGTVDSFSDTAGNDRHPIDILSDRVLLEALRSIEGLDVPASSDWDTMARLSVGSPSSKVDLIPAKNAVTQLRTNLSVKRKGQFYWISAKSDAPDKAATIANAVAESFFRLQREKADAALQQKAVNLDRDLSALRRELSFAETRYSNALRQRQLPRVENHPGYAGPKAIYFERLPVAGSGETRTFSPVDLSKDSSMAELADAYAVAQSQLAKLEEQLAPDQSALLKARAEKELLDRRIKEKVGELMGEASQPIVTGSIPTSPAHSYRAHQSHLPQHSFETIEQEVARIRDAYHVAKSKVSGALAAQLEKPFDARIVAPASVPANGSWNFWVWLLPLGTLLVGVLFLRTQLHVFNSHKGDLENPSADTHTVMPLAERKSEGNNESDNYEFSCQKRTLPSNEFSLDDSWQETEKHLHAYNANLDSELLGTIPLLTLPSSEQSDFLTVSEHVTRLLFGSKGKGRASWFQVCVAKVFGMILKLNNSGKTRKILFTSDKAGAGCSIAALSLAMRARSLGCSVLFVDACRGNPVVSSMKGAGKTESRVVGSKTIETHKCGLHFLKMQLNKPNSTNKNSFDFLDETYEFVIIDAPNLKQLPVGDPILKLIDAFVLVMTSRSLNDENICKVNKLMQFIEPHQVWGILETLSPMIPQLNQNKRKYTH